MDTSVLADYVSELLLTSGIFAGIAIFFIGRAAMMLTKLNKKYKSYEKHDGFVTRIEQKLGKPETSDEDAIFLFLTVKCENGQEVVVQYNKLGIKQGDKVKVMFPAGCPDKAEPCRRISLLIIVHFALGAAALVAVVASYFAAKHKFLG